MKAPHGWTREATGETRALVSAPLGGGVDQ